MDAENHLKEGEKKLEKLVYNSIKNSMDVSIENSKLFNENMDLKIKIENMKTNIFTFKIYKEKYSNLLKYNKNLENKNNNLYKTNNQYFSLIVLFVLFYLILILCFVIYNNK